MARATILFPIFLLITPYLISKLGAAGYGLWALTGIIASYREFVNFGLTIALVRFVAKEKATENYRAINEYLATAMVIFMVMLSLIYILIFTFRNFIAIRILVINEDVQVAVFLIIIAGVCSMVNMISGLFKSVIDGAQRMDISNIIITAQVITSSVGMFIVLYMGWGLRGLGYNLLVNSILGLLANLYYSKVALPQLKINPFLFSMSRLKNMFSYSINLQLSSLAAIWIQPLNKIIISHLFSVSHAGYYQIASKCVQNLSSLVRTVFLSLFPATAEHYEKGGAARIESLRKKAIKYTFPLVTMIFALTILVIPSFIILWLGSDFAIISTITRMLLLGAYASVLATPAFIMLQASGFSADTLHITIRAVFINITSCLGFGLLFGFTGFGAGFLITGVYAFFTINRHYKKRFGQTTNTFGFLKDNSKAIITTVILSIIAFACMHFVPLDSYIKILLFSLLFVGSYAMIIWKSKVITTSDIKVILGERFYQRIFAIKTS